MKTVAVEVTALVAGRVVGETEKAFKVAMPMHSPTGAEREFDAWMPKSRSARREDGLCTVAVKDAWLLSAKYEELEGRLRNWRQPIGYQAVTAGGEIEWVFAR